MLVYNAWQAREKKCRELRSVLECFVAAAGWYRKVMGWPVNQRYQSMPRYVAHSASVDGSEISVLAEHGERKICLSVQIFMQDRMYNACTIFTAYQRERKSIRQSPTMFGREVDNKRRTRGWPVP